MSLSLLNDAIATASLLSSLALPDPDPAAPPGFEAVATILGWAKWAGLIAAILALIGVAVMFMFNSRRGEGGEHLRTFVLILVGVMIIGAATALVGFISGA
jgi:ABC-type Fe3+-siderophore transport system permease subunit